MRPFSPRRGFKTMLLAALLVSAAVLLPATAPGNDVPTAKSATLGGDAVLTYPSNGHLVYQVAAEQGDTLIAYSWAVGTRTAAGSIRVLAPEATTVSAEPSATSSANGLLFWAAPRSGTYAVDFTGATGTQVSAGIFASRSRLTPTRATVVTAYNGTGAVACRFTDARYTYLPYDGPNVPFEGLMLSRSTDGVTWSPYWYGLTDVNGVLSRAVSGVERATYFRFTYAGAIYDSAGFGEATSSVITLLPRVRITPRSAGTVARRFSARATLLPGTRAVAADVLVQARKRGSARIFSFPASVVSAGVRGASLRGAVRLPSRGTWYVRWYRHTDVSFAETATKWVSVRVR